MSDTTTCGLRIAGLISRAELDEVLRILEREHVNPASAERAIRTNDSIYLDDMNFAQAPGRLLEILEEACVSFCWDWCPGDGYGAGRIAHDALAGVTTTQKCHDGTIVIDLREMNSPEVVKMAQMAEDLPQKLIGLIVYGSQHELLALLAERPELQPWHKARQARQARASAGAGS